MKTKLFALIAVVAMVMVSCKEPPYIGTPSNNDLVQGDTLPVIEEPTPEPTPDPEGVSIPAGTITVNEAVNICKRMTQGEITAGRYFIKGWVVGFNRGASFDTDFPKYGNDFVYLSARQDGKGTKQFYAYRLLGKFGAKFPDLECVQIGDFMVISCYPMNYNGIYESSGACFAYSSGNAHFNEIFSAFPGCPEPGEGEISVTEAEKIALELASKQTSTETYKIRGVVTSVDAANFNPSFGNMTFNISDGMSYATCYRLKAKDGAKFTSADQVAVGDTVLVEAKIQNYNGTCEPTQGNVIESTNPLF